MLKSLPIVHCCWFPLLWLLPFALYIEALLWWVHIHLQYICLLLGLIPRSLYSVLFVLYNICFKVYFVWYEYLYSSFIFLFLSDFFLTWVVLALQYCVCFCYTMKWISYMYTHIASLLGPLPTPSILSFWVATEHQAELYSKFALAIYFTHGSAHRSIWFTNSCHPSPPPHIWLLWLHFHSCPANRFSCIIFQDCAYACTSI